MANEPVSAAAANAATTTPTSAAAAAAADLRLRRPNRHQMSWAASTPDELIPAGHQARVIWAVVAKLDLSAFAAGIKARAGVCGRDATAPALLVALWLYAATRGVGSARELARLCKESDPYRWLCGGVSINHHTLSDFRVGHAAALDGLFTQALASMVDQGLVAVHRISQDGTRVRACAGAAGFRGEQRLAELLAEARAHVEELSALLDDPERSAGVTAKRRAARRRAARERVGRIEAAVARLAELKADGAAAAAPVDAASQVTPRQPPRPRRPPRPCRSMRPRRRPCQRRPPRAGRRRAAGPSRPCGSARPTRTRG